MVTSRAMLSLYIERSGEAAPVCVARPSAAITESPLQHPPHKHARRARAARARRTTPIDHRSEG